MDIKNLFIKQIKEQLRFIFDNNVNSIYEYKYESFPKSKKTSEFDMQMKKSGSMTTIRGDIPTKFSIPCAIIYDNSLIINAMVNLFILLPMEKYIESMISKMIHNIFHYNMSLPNYKLKCSNVDIYFENYSISTLRFENNKANQCRINKFIFLFGNRDLSKEYITEINLYDNIENYNYEYIEKLFRSKIFKHVEKMITQHQHIGIRRHNFQAFRDHVRECIDIPMRKYGRTIQNKPYDLELFNVMSTIALLQHEIALLENLIKLMNKKKCESINIIVCEVTRLHTINIKINLERYIKNESEKYEMERREKYKII